MKKIILFILFFISYSIADVTLQPGLPIRSEIANKSDSLVVFVTPTQLADSTAALRSDLAGSGGLSYTEYFILDAGAGQTDLDSAITAIAGGGATNPCIVLTPGTYTLSTNKTLENIAIVGQERLSNTGFYKQAKTIHGAEISLAGAYFTVRDNVLIKDVVVTITSGSLFTGFYLNQSGTAIDNVYFDGVVFYDADHNNTHASPSWIENTENSSVVIKDCAFYGKIDSEKWRAFFDNDSYNTDLIFENNYTYAMARGFYSNAGATGSNQTWVSNNIFEDCDYAFYFTDGQGGTYYLKDNQFISSNTFDVRLSASASSMTLYDYGNGVYTYSGSRDNLTAYYGPDELFEVDASGFTGNLSTSDSTLDAVLSRLDNYSGGSGISLVSIQSASSPINPSYWFDGVDDYLSIADNALLNPDSLEFSIQVKIKVYDIVDANQFLVNKESGGVGYGLEIREDDLWIRLDDNTTDVSAIIATAVFEVGGYYDIHATFDRQEYATAYINGVEAGTVNISTANKTLSNAGAFTIGSETGGTTKPFHGEISLVRFYNGVNDLAQVREAMNTVTDHSNQSATWVDLNTGYDFTSGWTATANSTINNASSFTTSATGDYGVYKDLSLVAGQSYRIHYAYSDDAGINTEIRIGSGAVYQTVAILSPSTSYHEGYVDFTVLPNLTNNNLMLIEKAASSVTWFDLSVMKNGTVLELLPQTVGLSYWYGATTNALEATVSGALTTNKPTVGTLNVKETVYLKEQAAANTDVAGYGQVWVKNTTPNQVWFTDDTGTDVQLGASSASADTLIIGELIKSNGSSSSTVITSANTFAIVQGWSTVGEMIGASYDGTNKGIKVTEAGLYECTAVISVLGSGTGTNVYVFDFGNQTARWNAGNCRETIDSQTNWHTVSIKTYHDVADEDTICLWGTNTTDGDDFEINGGSMTIKRLTYSR